MEERHRRRSLFWPVLLIAVGIVMLLNTVGRLGGTTWEMLWRLWPLLFIVGGLDSLYRGEGFAGAVVSIGAGTLFLLGNLGYLSISSFWELVRFWPVLLIAFGLDLMIGRRGLLSSLIGLAIGLLLIAGIVWMTVGTGAVVMGRQVRNDPQAISQPLQGASRGSVNLTMIGGRLSVRGGAPPDTLISGELARGGSDRYLESYEVSDGVGHYKLEAQGLNMLLPGGFEDNDWNLRLPPRLPFDLKSVLVFGEQLLDLSNTQVRNLDTETIFGKALLTVPKAGNLNAKISVVFGQLVVRVPEGAAVRIDTSGGLGSENIPDDFRREGDIYYSPQAGNAAEVMIIEASPVIGSLVVETVP